MAQKELAGEALNAVQEAYRFAARCVRPEGYWCGECKSNVTITADYIFLLQALGCRKPDEEEPICRYLLSLQNGDGSWSLAPGHPGDASTTAEAYLALKIMGLRSESSSAMRKAQSWMRHSKEGGIERVHVMTRVQLAMFGLLPWATVPEIPAELILLPSSSPFSIYRFSSWARIAVVPMLVVCHYRPIFALPDTAPGGGSFIDELWQCPERKRYPRSESFLSLLCRGDLVACGFTLADKLLGSLNGFRSCNPIRRYALDQCMEWIRVHQEPTGDWAGYFPPTAFSILALRLEGHRTDSITIRRGLEAIERNAWVDDQGKRIQACISSVWDTILMCVALADVDTNNASPYNLGQHKTLRTQALTWLREQQLLGYQGDWRIYRPRLAPGSWTFGHNSNWYPDVDDTAAAVIALLKDDIAAVNSNHVLDACEWILGMEGADGGWAAFDVDNDRLYLNKSPFAAYKNLSDPSTADIVGRILEAFGLFLLAARQVGVSSRASGLIPRIQLACARGMDLVTCRQELNGAWYGRWGVQYIYGTSNVLAGLAYHWHSNETSHQRATCGRTKSPAYRSALLPAIRRALRFLMSIQNADGGWGESLATYGLAPVTPGNMNEVQKLCSVSSTPTQTAWAIIGLLPYLHSSHPSIEKGIPYLVRSQDSTSLKSATMDGPGLQRVDSVTRLDHAPFDDLHEEQKELGMTWSSEAYTGTGFPGHWYQDYALYNHYFPMMALREYLRTLQQDKAGTRTSFPLDDEPRV